MRNLVLPAELLLACLSLGAAGCTNAQENPDKPVAMLAADVDRSKPAERVLYQLADSITFSISYPDTATDEARICFSRPAKTTCRNGTIPGSLQVRPDVILDDASQDIMVGFRLPGGEALDIWLLVSQDLITIGDNERVCAIRGRPLSDDCS